MLKLGDIRKPSKWCVKWEHDRSKCYDKYERRIIGGKKYSVWVCYCQEERRIGNQACGIANKVIGKKEARK